MSLLDRIMSLTTAIEDSLAGADWAGATNLDLERRELLRELFATQPEAAREGHSRAILAELRARTDSSAAALETTRSSLSAAAWAVRTSPGVVRAYERNTDSGPLRVAQPAGE